MFHEIKNAPEAQYKVQYKVNESKICCERKSTPEENRNVADGLSIKLMNQKYAVNEKVSSWPH